MAQQIKQLSQIQHVLARPGMYIGSIVQESQEEFGLVDDKFVILKRDYIPGLIKIFNEVIDNSIDEYVRTEGKHSDKISVKMTSSTFECQDNGRGIPNKKMTTLQGHEKYQAEVAFTEMLSGANYDNDNEATIGTNGLGGKASSIFSLRSLIKNDDGQKLISITTSNNLNKVQVKELESKSSGVHVKITPDLEYFGIKEIDLIHFDVIKERLLHLSVSYPGITFRFNGKSLKINSKNYFQMFGAKEYIDLGNVQIAVAKSESEQFEHFSLVNGIITKNGGRHIIDITDEIVKPIRDKLVKKFKTIKPGDVKNHLRVLVIFREFMNARYDSQTKEVLKNSSQEVKEYLRENDFGLGVEKLVKKIQKNEDIMLSISELFLLKEQAKQNAELKKLKNKSKKPKSDKFMPPIGSWTNIFLCEGDSAANNASLMFDRTGNGFFAMFGVPPNTWEMTPSDIIKSKKLVEIQHITGLDFSTRKQENMNFENIIIFTDYDLPGHFIAGQLLGMFFKYSGNLIQEGRVKRFVTPLIIVKDREKLVKWFYTFDEYQAFLSTKLGQKKSLVYEYKKGIGSWSMEDMEHIIEKDGLDKMMLVFKDDEETQDIMNDWLSSSKSDKRKDMLDGYEFNIMNQ